MDSHARFFGITCTPPFTLLAIGHDDVVVRGDPAERSFSVIYLKESRVIALDCVNRVKDYVQGRGLVVAGTAPEKTALADVSRPLKDLGGTD